MSGRALPTSCEHSCGECIWLQYPQLLAEILWTDPSDQAAADSCKWVVCCLKYMQEMFFHGFPLPSTVMSHSAIFPICQSQLTAIRKWNVPFYLSGAFLGDNFPACSLWRGIEQTSLAAVSARHLHKPTSLPPHPSNTGQAAPFCKTLQVRETHNKCQSTAGKHWNPGVPSQEVFFHMDFQLATQHHLSDTANISSSKSALLIISQILPLFYHLLSFPSRLSNPAGMGFPYRSPV